MTAPDPIDAAVRRAAEAFRLAAPELDPRSPAGYGPWRAALEAAGLPAALARVAELEAERDGLKNSILDIDAHATPYGVRPEDPDGNPAAYLVTVGALHRAIGKVGHTAAPYHVVLARMVSAEAAVERVRTLHIKRTGLCPECMVIWPCPTIRALDAAGTPATPEPPQ